MCALFSPEILQVGVVKGLKEEYKLCHFWAFNRRYLNFLRPQYPLVGMDGGSVQRSLTVKRSKRADDSRSTRH